MNDVSVEPLTIYECPTNPASPVGKRCCDKAVPVRVFREELVRPLWEAASSRVIHDTVTGSWPANDAADAFPAPEDWKR